MDKKRSLKEMLWTDEKHEFPMHIRGLVPLPNGLIGCKCPKCGSEK